MGGRYKHPGSANTGSSAYRGRDAGGWGTLNFSSALDKSQVWPADALGSSKFEILYTSPCYLPMASPLALGPDVVIIDATLCAAERAVTVIYALDVGLHSCTVRR